jgi:UDP-2,4-diacetamido-2,4,6-trideoxy-beta-L-altropyranose hydrolase
VRVVFRTDASLMIGTGHVMRCLALADALVTSGAECQFICRVYEGNLIELIRSKGYTTLTIEPATETVDVLASKTRGDTTYTAHRLGALQSEDAAACAPILAELRPDWLIVDHYSLDAKWESALVPHYRKLMVIDDLADRLHVCDLLLDQTFGRNLMDYLSLVPANCRLMCGSKYALVRSEFAAMRPYSLQRRLQPTLHELLITMGGVDVHNATGEVLQALRTCPLPADCRITVVMGVTAPHLEKVREEALDFPWAVRLLVGVNDMARLMATSDLAIGAGGTTSWERCCLGVPTIMLVLAENQRRVAHGLEQFGAAKVIDFAQGASNQLRAALAPLIEDMSQLLRMSQCAASIVDGSGIDTLIRQMDL